MTDNRWIHQSSRHAEFPRSLEKITQEGFSVLMKLTLRFSFSILIVLASLTSLPALSQDWVHTGSGLGNARIRLAASDFKAVGADAQTPALKATFDSTLFNDLANAGIFDMVAKALAPAVTPAAPAEVNLAQWSAAPANAAMLALGSLAVQGGRINVSGYLIDVKEAGAPAIVGKQYGEVATQDNARLIAHKFADEIILRLGGGVNGIAETKIYYVSSRSGVKEIWAMDYDGQGEHAITHLGEVSLSPHVSPDNSRVAFASLGRTGWTIRMYSLDAGSHGQLPIAGWHHNFTRMVGGRRAYRLLVRPLWRSGDLGLRCKRWRSRIA